MDCLIGKFNQLNLNNPYVRDIAPFALKFTILAFENEIKQNKINLYKKKQINSLSIYPDESQITDENNAYYKINFKKIIFISLPFSLKNQIKILP